MIILQILAGILLVPFTAVLLILFNVYLKHWIYILCITCVALFYSLLCSLLFLHTSTIAWVFMLLTILYVIRMSYLDYHIQTQTNDNKHPLLRGKIKIKNGLSMTLYFPLSFLSIFKLLPKSVSQKLTRQTKLNIEIPALINLIQEHSKGTRLEVITNETMVYFEIQ